MPGYEAKLRVRERRHPKLHWVDPGLVRAVRGDRGAPDAVARGALFEGWIAQCLSASQDYRDLCDEILWWAPAAAVETEVDFLLRRGREFIAIEANASARWKPSWRADSERSLIFQG